MALGKIEKIGQSTIDILAMFGDFFLFAGSALLWAITGGVKWKNIRLVLPQIYEVGVRSVPVICITGAFIGMVMAIELYSSFASYGQQNELGVAITLSVVKQIGPVLTAVMLAGRVGGALAAELGTMNVTEQLDALRVMGSDPIQYLVVPRVIACVLLTPILTVYSDFCGIMGGWFISVFVLHIPNQPFWIHTMNNVEVWQVMEGIDKSFFFGLVIGMISCFKGFTSGAGASGVGRACTESFVTSFITIIMLNFVFAQVLKQIYSALYGNRGVVRVKIIELRDVHKTFGPLVVLDGLSLSVEPGETVVVIGASGSGKSVTLKLIVGLLQPDAGEVLFDGRPIQGLSQRALVPIRRQIGFLFQGGALFDSMTVEENVAFPLVEGTNKPPEEIDRLVDEKLLMIGLPDIRRKMPAELSGGQRKRVALARAIAMEPRLILYDEPTTGLDPVRADIINELILKLQRELHVTSVVVTHDMHSALKVGDRIVMLFKGKIIFNGTPEDLQRCQDPEVCRFVEGKADERELAMLRETHVEERTPEAATSRR